MALKLQVVRARIIWFALKLQSYVARPLPVTPNQLDALIHRVSVINGYPSDQEARVAIATAVLHISMDKNGIPIWRAKDAYFAALMRRSVTNQVAFEIVDAKRQAVMEAREAAAAAKQA